MYRSFEVRHTDLVPRVTGYITWGKTETNELCLFGVRSSHCPHPDPPPPASSHPQEETWGFLGSGPPWPSSQASSTEEEPAQVRARPHRLSRVPRAQTAPHYEADRSCALLKIKAMIYSPRPNGA